VSLGFWLSAVAVGVATLDIAVAWTVTAVILIVIAATIDHRRRRWTARAGRFVLA
jgi:hypothetical protein